jgi:hypothetical protein
LRQLRNQVLNLFHIWTNRHSTKLAQLTIFSFTSKKSEFIWVLSKLVLKHWISKLTLLCYTHLPPWIIPNVCFQYFDDYVYMC